MGRGVEWSSAVQCRVVLCCVEWSRMAVERVEWAVEWVE